MTPDESNDILQRLGISTIDDIFKYVEDTWRGSPQSKYQPDALAKATVITILKELGPSAWNIYNEAVKTGKVEQGGKKPDEWVRLLPAASTRHADKKVEQLVEMSGQTRERCEEALRRNNGDANAAAALLLQPSPRVPTPTGGAPSKANPFSPLRDDTDSDTDSDQPTVGKDKPPPPPPPPKSTENPSLPAALPLQPTVPAPVPSSRSPPPDAPQPPSPSSPRARTSLFPYDNFKPRSGKLVWVVDQFASCDNYDFGMGSPRSYAGLGKFAPMYSYYKAIRELKEKNNLVVECWDDPEYPHMNDRRLQHHVNYFLAHVFESHHVWIGEKKVRDLHLAEQEEAASAPARKLLKEKASIEALDEAKWPDRVHDFLHKNSLQLCDADFKDTQTGAFISSDYLKFGRGEDGKQWLVVRLDLTLDMSKDLAPIFVLFEEREEPAEPADPQLPGPCWDLKKFASLSECTGQDHNNDGTKRDIHRYAVIDWEDPPQLAPFRGKKVPWDGRITIEGLNNEHLMKDKEGHGRVQKILDEMKIPPHQQHSHLKMCIDMTRTRAESQPDLARMQHFREKRPDGTTRSVVQHVLPLYLRGDIAKFDLAIVLSSRTLKTHASTNDGNPANYKYMTQTVLEPEMVYGNCRLLGSINQQWLLASGVHHLRIRSSLHSEEDLQNMNEEQLRSVVRRSDIQAIDERYLKCDVPATGAISRIMYEDNGTIKSAFIEPDDGYPLPKGHGGLFAWLKGRNDIPNNIAKGTRVHWDGIQLGHLKDSLQARNLQLEARPA
mmetsp:Transcript_7928/g.19694  ORF Transcript_7928/g.19694 Transcript_7928/m.19694 type:complete len:778 (-) Transcript_7928:171-2504(-)